MKENRKSEKKRYFTGAEWALWGGSSALILLSGWIFGSDWLTLTASLVGAASLILNAKGHPLGQALMVLFSLLYGWISWEQRYYGEMLTYVGMTMPMALFSLISWLRHPFQGDRGQVTVARLSRRSGLWMWGLTAAVTTVFFFVLRAFHTANLFFSTVSVATSFLAVFLTFFRSSAYALAYAANDVVLIVLWTLAMQGERRYGAVVVCFAVFLVNDVYGLVAWRRMARRQAEKNAKNRGTESSAPR